MSEPINMHMLIVCFFFFCIPITRQKSWGWGKEIKSTRRRVKTGVCGQRRNTGNLAGRRRVLGRVVGHLGVVSQRCPS